MGTVRGGVDATVALIAINVIVFLASGGFSLVGNPGNSSLIQHGELSGPAISGQHEYWRLATSAFLHANVLHIAVNMYLLYLLGGMLEPALGRTRFVIVYAVALLAGSCGALIATPNSPSIGASGAIFGLMGAAVVEMRARGIDPMQSGIAGLIAINLIISFAVPGISVGAHVGGLIGGALAAGALQLGERYRSQALGLLASLLLGVGAVAGGLAAASAATPPAPHFLVIR